MIKRRVCSLLITFRRSAIIDNNLKFDIKLVLLQETELIEKINSCLMHD